MLVLQASEEQENTFNKLIQTMGEQIVWEGRFIVKDNELILEGTVRSLFFQFETKKVVTNLIDLPVRDDQVIDVSRHPKLRDLINMVLYAFGKWGTLRGLRVEQDYQQLNQLFSKILSMYYIEPSFRKENFRFYKVGVRVTYEEVLQTVLEFEKKLEEDPAAESQGLWHTLIWKNRQRKFQKEETSLEERAHNRIGNNFYLTGYQCPVCSEKLHMAVYPDGKEVRIDTEEKGVYLARVYTCENCNCFYTPRPERLIYEGFIYEMTFGDDVRAYEDYMELLGRNAQRTANFKYNEYEAVRNLRLQREEAGKGSQKSGPDELHSSQDALKQMEDFARNLPGLPEDVFRRFAHRVEEGFYPDTAVAKHEKQIRKQERQLDAQEKRAMEENLQADGAKSPQAAQRGDAAGNRADTHVLGKDLKRTRSMPPRRFGMQETSGAEHNNADRRGTADFLPEYSGHESAGTQADAPYGAGGTAGLSRSTARNAAGSQDHSAAGAASRDHSAVSGGHTAYSDGADSFSSMTQNGDTGTGINAAAYSTSGDGIQADELWHGTLAADTGKPEAPYSEAMERYQGRMGVLERLSQRQRSDLKRQIKNDSSLTEQEKNDLNSRIAELEFDEQAKVLLKKAESGARKSYSQIKSFIQEAEKEPYPDSLKRPFIEKLRTIQKSRGEEEVKKLMETVPARLDREGFQKLEQKLKSYEGIDLSPYTETLRSLRETAEKQEIANVVKRSRKKSRSDYTDLMRRLEEKKFADDSGKSTSDG